LLQGQSFSRTYAEIGEDEKSTYERFNMRDLNRESTENVIVGVDDISLSNKEDIDDESHNECDNESENSGVSNNLISYRKCKSV
jgi:hypothetical protein